MSKKFEKFGVLLTRTEMKNVMGSSAPVGGDAPCKTASSCNTDSDCGGSGCVCKSGGTGKFCACDYANDPTC